MKVMKIYKRIKELSAGIEILIKLAQSVEIPHAMFVVYVHHQWAKNASAWIKIIFLGDFMQGSSRGGQLTPLVAGIKLDQERTICNPTFALLN